MAGVKDKDLLLTLGWPEGLDNVNPESQVKPDRLRAAENVDLDRFGKPGRRGGYRRVVSCTSGRSLYHHAGMAFALFVDGTTMYGLRPDMSTFVVKTGLAPQRDVSYTTVDNLTYWSNGIQNGTVTAAGAGKDWGCETPHGQPNLAVSTNGGLSAGNYQVAFTFAKSNGEESGAFLAAPIDIPEGKGIAVSAVPQPVSSEVVVVRAYVTPFDGDVLYWVRDLPVGMTSFNIGAFVKGKVLETQFMGQMPPGHFVRYLNGRIYVASGNTLYWSEALRYGLTSLAHGNLPFDAEIDLLEPAEVGEEPGQFIAAGNRTYFLPSGKDAKPSEMRVVYPHGAVRGTGVSVPGSVFGQSTAAPVSYWIASNGVSCIGLPSGEVVPLRERQAVAPPSTGGASLYREWNGLRQVITALRGASGTNFGVQDTAVATVYRNGVKI